MPPKKGAATKQAKSQANGTADAAKSKPTANQGSKRKSTSNTTNEPNKAPRRSGRGAAKPSISPAKLISYLLSPAATELCRPKDEKNAEPKLMTYTSNLPLSPFEELLSAVVLSRPISHALGQRAIRTLLNTPYSLRTPGKIKDAGSERVHKALEDARTQHKAKTAEQVVLLADVVAKKFAKGGDDTSLEPLRKEADSDSDVLRETLTKSIKGVGKTGVDIFVRRVQAVWKECYPFVDERTKGSLEKIGLEKEADALRKQIDDVWRDLKLGEVEGGSEEERKRKTFARVLERAVGADLEGKVDDLLTEAGKS